MLGLGQHSQNTYKEQLIQNICPKQWDCRLLVCHAFRVKNAANKEYFYWLGGNQWSCPFLYKVSWSIIPPICRLITFPVPKIFMAYLCIDDPITHSVYLWSSLSQYAKRLFIEMTNYWQNTRFWISSNKQVDTADISWQTRSRSKWCFIFSNSMKTFLSINFISNYCLLTQ